MHKKIKNVFLDGLKGEITRTVELDMDLPLYRFVIKHKNSSSLLGSSGSGKLFTDDSKLYITPEEYRRAKRGERIVRLVGRLDSLHARSFEKSRIYTTGPTPAWFSDLLYAKFRDYSGKLLKDSGYKLSLVKAWNLSIVGSIIFGMLIMTMIYRNLGQSVSASINDHVSKPAPVAVEEKIEDNPELSAEESVRVDVESIRRMISDYENYTTEQFAEEIRKMVSGYPIEKMIPQIAKQERIVAAFIIGIAKQESDWGKRIPVYRGQDCFNYWGWRGENAVGTGGHTCFASPEEAVATVAKRLEFLVSAEKRNTPEKMIIWKCGDCSWDKPENMQRWINAVSIYFQKLNKK